MERHKVNEATLVRITGWKARVLKIIVGTPFLIIAALLLSVVEGDLMALKNILLLTFGSVFGIYGAYGYFSAIRGDDFTIDYSRDTSQE